MFNVFYIYFLKGDTQRLGEKHNLVSIHYDVSIQFFFSFELFHVLKVKCAIYSLFVLLNGIAVTVSPLNNLLVLSLSSIHT